MWLKTRRINPRLAPLAAVIGAELADGRVRGIYNGDAVEAWPMRHYPGSNLRHQAGTPPPKDVNTFIVTLAGVPGNELWHCWSAPSSVVATGPLLARLRSPEFTFERVVGFEGEASLSKKWGAFAKRLSGFDPPVADTALQERLVADGLFEELSALRWGRHPYLPKVGFTPPASEIAERWLESGGLGAVAPTLDERLRAAGQPDLQSAIGAQLRKLGETQPGRLQVEVEVGRARIPSPEQFRELLERAVRIAQINASANSPAEPDGRSVSV